jgi:hypothetical protein
MTYVFPFHGNGFTFENPLNVIELRELMKIVKEWTHPPPHIPPIKNCGRITV